MRTEIMNNVTRSLHKVGFKIRKHSPEILIVVGVVGTVTSAVMACKATTKVNDILEDAKATVDAIHEVADTSEEYTNEDKNKALGITYVKTGLKFAKLYGPSVALGVASLGCIIASNGVLRKRNMALAAAYATEHIGFKEYRDRVIDRFGKELDKELKYNLKAREIEEVVVDENGEEKTVKTTVTVAEGFNETSEYARFFCEGNPGWEKDAEHNLYYLRCQQNFANDLLKERGHLFLNEVYDMLGIPRTRAGQEVGWIYDEEHPIGDNYVDFGIYDVRDERKREFVNGRERSILLDFNVDGYILELMH